MLLSCLLAVLFTGPQDPAPGPTITERIDALIAKSNAYEGFVAHYRVRTGDGSELTMRIAYSAPQTLVLDVQCDEFRSFTRLKSDCWDDIRFQRGTETRRASVKNWNLTPGYARHLRAIFEAEYPGVLRAEDLPENESPIITLRPGRESMSFSFGFGAAHAARLDWLARIRRAPERLTLSGDANKELAFSYTDDMTMFVSCESGFVTRLQKPTKSGVLQGVELVSVQTDTRPADAELALPDTGTQVGDFSGELEESTVRMGFSNSRQSLSDAFAQTIDDGRIQWTEETPAKLERMVRAMRAVDFEPVCARMLAKTRGVLSDVTAKVAEMVRELDPGDEAAIEQLSGTVDATRRGLADLLGKYLNDGQSQEGSGRKCKLRPSLQEEIAALEKRILAEMFAERVAKPMLAEYEAKVAKQLDAK